MDRMICDGGPVGEESGEANGLIIKLPPDIPALTWFCELLVWGGVGGIKSFEKKFFIVSFKSIGFWRSKAGWIGKPGVGKPKVRYI